MEGWRTISSRQPVCIREELDKAKARIKELEEALKPFASYSAYMDGYIDDVQEAPTLYDMRKARRALEAK